MGWAAVALLALGLAQSRLPTGTYSATVATYVGRPQEIRVTAFGDRRRGVITLRGMVECREEFRYDHDAARGWTCVFGERVRSVLRRYGCRLSEFEFDRTNDVAYVSLRLPVLGARRLKLRRESAAEAIG